MSKLTWVIAIVAIALWTLLSVGGYVIVHWTAQWITLNADSALNHSEVTQWLVWAVDLLRDVGVFVLAAVWALVSIGIVLAAWALQRGNKLLRANG